MTELHEIFRLDSETGRIYWIKPTKYHPRMAGKEAGSMQKRKNGKTYCAISLNGKKMKRGRIVFYMTHGFWPSPCIDHINGDSTDDRPINLRQATIEQNAWNHKSRAKQSSLPMGVRLIKSSGNYEARIIFKKKAYHLGAFKTPDEASLVYLAKRKELFGEFA